jgi:PAS domain S-box-containing protein
MLEKAFPSEIKILMKKLLAVLALFYVQAANAGLIQYFKDEQGETKWQYVANFSSGVLILLLSAAVITLFFSHRRAQKANRALENIRNVLEQRVRERTATLDDSNRLLKETNLLLEGEISQHEETANLLRLSEAYIKDILESMPLMLIGLNKEMNVTQWNMRAEKITGIKSQNVLGKNLWDAYPTITISPNQISEVLQNKKPVTIKHSQRGQYYFDITIYPLHDQIETGLVILIDDVTQRILTENMLIQRDKMSSMGELASTMAHDIDTPLQAILQDLLSVQRYIKEGEERKSGADVDNRIIGLLADAAEKGRQASGVISNLLDFSRAHGDKKRSASIPDIIDHTIELAADVLSEPSGLRFRDIKVERHYEDNLPSLPCYVSELQQVFLSLFRHACHSLGQVGTDGFQPLIRIDVIECYDALWIKVQHNGRGLDSQEQQYIFEPFFHNSEGNDVLEAGKRLSFSYFIITEHHRGQMAVTSDLDVGTTFHIQLQHN